MWPGRRRKNKPTAPAANQEHKGQETGNPQEPQARGRTAARRRAPLLGEEDGKPFRFEAGRGGMALTLSDAQAATVALSQNDGDDGSGFTGIAGRVGPPCRDRRLFCRSLRGPP